MFANPFAELSASIPAAAMQVYVIIMLLLVVGGTILDVLHKKSAEYFFEKARKTDASGLRPLSGARKSTIAVQTVAVDVLTSAEFCTTERRVAHLLTMYGFVFFLVATVAMVFFYASPAASTPWVWPFLWHVGALMVCGGGLWFWFFMRVDLAAEGNPWYRIVQADLFVLSLLATNAFGFMWSVLQALGAQVLSWLFLVLFVLAGAVLFGGVLWSKFAHMFFKPAAAYQKRIAKANGSLDNLPKPADRTDPATRDRHSMDLLKDAPLDMGLGIKREQPQHY